MASTKVSTVGSNPSSLRVGQAAGELPAFLQNILESSTEYSIIGKDLDGKILLWNEGARRGRGQSQLRDSPSARRRESRQAAHDARSGAARGQMGRDHRPPAQKRRAVHRPRGGHAAL